MDLAVLQRLQPFKLLQEDTTVTVKSHTRQTKSGTERVRQYTRVLHGTRQEVLDKVLAKGVLPGTVTGYKNWDYLKPGENEKDVFVSTNKQLAVRFGKVAARDGPFAVVEARIPADVKLRVDRRVEHKAGTPRTSYRVSEVKPEWITKIDFYEVGGRQLETPKKSFSSMTPAERTQFERYSDLYGRVLHKRTVKIKEAQQPYVTVYVPLPVDHPLVKPHNVQEATTVKAHVAHSKSGKAYNVKQFERNVGGERGDPRNLSLPFPKRAAPTPLKLSGAFTDPLASHYHYHATNIENAYDIAAHGLRPHEPSYGTDQQAWPDGSTQLRTYFGTPDSVWSFAPENGTPVVLRVKRNATRFRAESGTGDTYARSTIRPKFLEILTAKGWRPISVLAQQQQVHEATATVRAHTAHSKRGKAYNVRQYQRSYTKAAARMKIIGATPNEDKYIRELLSRHDQAVVRSVPYIGVLNRKDFQRALKNATDYKADGTEVGWYDEKKAFIAFNRSNMTGPEDYKSTLDHELGHAAYFHSPKAEDWDVAYLEDKKFDRFTAYARTNMSEGFAEAYMAFTAAGGKAKNPRYRKVFDVVQSVIRTTNPRVNQYLKQLKALKGDKKI